MAARRVREEQVRRHRALGAAAGPGLLLRGKWEPWGSLGRSRRCCDPPGPPLAAGLRPGHPGTPPRQQVGARMEGSRQGEEGRLSGELVLCKHWPGTAHRDGQVASVSLPLVTTALHVFLSSSMNDLFSGL